MMDDQAEERDVVAGPILVDPYGEPTADPAPSDIIDLTTPDPASDIVIDPTIEENDRGYPEVDVVDLRDGATRLSMGSGPRELGDAETTEVQAFPADSSYVKTTWTVNQDASVDGGVLLIEGDAVAFDEAAVRELEEVGAPRWLIARATKAAETDELRQVGAPAWLVERASQRP